MQYVGGKTKSGGAQIATTINAAIERHRLQSYLEPFVGGLSVLSRVRAPKRLASDSCEALITLYQAMQRGWVPPTELDRNEWARLKATRDPADPLTAFAGFGCSLFGSWFQDFVSKYKFTKRVVPAAEAAAQSLTKKMARCTDVGFEFCDYRCAPRGDIIYCDPPYRGTLGYGAVDPWDPDTFWGWALERSRHSMVAVSEMQAPAGWIPLLTFDVQHRIATGGGGRRIEHLYVPEAQRDAWADVGPLFAARTA